MVAPLIVGAARMVGGKKFAGRVNARIKRPELLNRIQRRENLKQRREDRREKIQNRDEFPLIENEKLNQYRNTKKDLRSAHALKNALPSKSLTTVNKIKAFSVSVPIFSFAIGFWIPQMIFWMIGIFGLGAGSIPFIDYVIPGELIYMLSYSVIVFIGLCTMFYAAIVYNLRRVRCFKGYKMVVFIFCIVGYFIIFLNFFPWFVVWLLAVTYLQDD